MEEALASTWASNEAEDVESESRPSPRLMR
jgi:hypothetical protein